MSGRRWEPAEVAAIHEVARRTRSEGFRPAENGYHLLAERLGRTKVAVQLKALRIGEREFPVDHRRVLTQADRARAYRDRQDEGLCSCMWPVRPGRTTCSRCAARQAAGGAPSRRSGALRKLMMDLLRVGLAAPPPAPEVVWNGRRDGPNAGMLSVEADERREPPPEMVELPEPGRRRTGSRLPTLRP